MSTEPVNLISGNYLQQHQDLSIPARGMPTTLTRTYNSAAVSLDSPFGFGWTHSDNQRLIIESSTSIVAASDDGRLDRYTADASGNFTGPPAIYDKLSQNADGSFTLTKKDQQREQYSASGQLTSIADRNGNRQTFAYDVSGNLATITDTVGRAFTLTSDANGHITTITEPDGRSLSYSYDANGNLATVTDQAGGTTAYSYDANHQLLTIVDPRGNTIVTNTYDGSGHVIRQSDALGKVTTFVYGAGQTQVTDPLGHTTTTTYDSQLRVTGQQDALGGTLSYTYDANSNRASVTDQNGHSTGFAYDAQGNVTRITDARGGVTASTYDAMNNLLTSTDPLGRTTTNVYDSRGNLTQSTNPVGGVTKLTYDASGQLLTGTDPNGAQTSYAYDAQGNLTSVTDPLHAVTHTSYDGMGRPLTKTDANGHTTTLSYDALDRLLNVTDPLGHTTAPTFDGDGNRTSTTDANNHTTAYTYDADGRLTKVTDALGGTTSYAYDAAGNQTGRTDANGHTTTSTFDALNRVATSTDPLNRTNHYGYDAAGNLLTITDPQGQTTTYAYDAKNERTGISYSDGQTPNVTVQYDAAGERTGMTDGSGTSTWNYDGLGHVLSATDGAGVAVGYAYDHKGQLTSISYPGNQTVGRSYDAAGRLTQVTDWLGHSTSFAYDPAANLTSETFPASSGLVDQFSYDSANRLMGIGYTKAGSAYRSFAYTRDADNQVTAETITGASRQGDVNGDANLNAVDALCTLRYTASLPTTPACSQLPFGAADPVWDVNGDGAINAVDALCILRVVASLPVTQACPTLASTSPPATQSYGYTAVNQLKSVNQGAYTYDPADNLTQLTSGAGLAYDAANELTALTAGTQTTSFTVDPRGNRTGMTPPNGRPVSYAYDQANRLTTYSNPNGGATASYAYNGDGLRVRKTVGSSTQPFVWDLAEDLPLLLKDGSTSFIYGPGGQPLEQIDVAGMVLYFHHDQLGSTRLLTDATGMPVATYSYDAYGNLTSHNGAAGTTLTYAGQYTDAESGLLYLRARYYDPATARFISRDPFPALDTVPHSINRYVYAGNSPISLTDPTGYLSWDDAARHVDVYALSELVSPLFNDIHSLALGWQTQREKSNQYQDCLASPDAAICGADAFNAREHAIPQSIGKPAAKAAIDTEQAIYDVVIGGVPTFKDLVKTVSKNLLLKSASWVASLWQGSSQNRNGSGSVLGASRSSYDESSYWNSYGGSSYSK
ncbi:MAG: RHS repeat-associated core domain-containing protein [Dehalococcoidia bacterium]